MLDALQRVLKWVARAIGDAGIYGADKLVAPIATGVAVGIAVRAAAVPGEVDTKTRRAGELNSDLRRLVGNREREVRDEEARVKGGIFMRAMGGTFVPGGSGTGVRPHREIADAHERALHEYRDAASRAVREFTQLAQSEGFIHRLIRRHRGVEPALTLPAETREAWMRWREAAKYPARATRSRPIEIDDHTSGEDELATLENEAGLTWRAARAGVRNG